MRSFLRLLKYLRFYKSKVGLSILFYLLTALFSTLSIALLWPFLTILFDQQEAIEAPVEFVATINGSIEWMKYQFQGFVAENGKTRALTIVCLIIILVFFLKNLFRYLATFVLTPVRNGIIYQLRQQLFSKLLKLPVGWFSEKRKGDLMARMTSDLHEIEISILNMLQTLFREPLMILFALGAMLMINVKLTFFVFGLLMFTGIIIGQIGRTLKRRSKHAQTRLGRMMSALDETLAGLRIVKAFNAYQSHEANFDEHNQSYRKTMNKLMWRKDLSSPLSEFLGISVFVVLLWYGSQLVFDAALDAPTFFVFLGLFQQIINPSKAFSSAFYNIQKGMAANERVDELMDAENAIMETENPIPIFEFKKEIEFKSVRFEYEDDTEVLKGINLVVTKGKTIAIVGESGGGKSTLVDLIPRFHDPTGGAIFIDGIDIQKYKLADLRSLIGMVTQQPILFHDTIRNNILFGTKGTTEEGLIEAAKIANAHDFILATEKGYDTIIGDRGDKLSGGERQRITIARAILNNPDILILDEATSSLDAVSERQVQKALLKLTENRTSIVIAHRLSTIQHADEIIVIQDGTIIERGTHESLIRNSGPYKELVELQAF
ncbi:MAG: ABC transporter ATP-binding protein [Bacteroidota bacterium]